MRTKLLVLTTKSGEIVGICPAPPSGVAAAGPFVTITPASSEHRLHEIDVPQKVMELASPKELAAAVAKYLPRAHRAPRSKKTRG